MRIPVLAMTATLALAACSSTVGGKLATCDGKHLRPANPYGTVLAPAARIGTPTPPPDGTTEAKPKALSAADLPRSFGSCRV